MIKSKKLVAALVGLIFLIPTTPASAGPLCYKPGPDTDLSFCNFVGIDLSGYDLSNSTLTGANLTNTNLTGATLTNVQAEKVVGVPRALPKGWAVNKRFLIGPRANLSSFDLSTLDLNNANLRGADLSSAILTNVNLTKADLTDSILDFVRGNGITGTPKAMPAGWVVQKGVIFGATADLSELTLTDIDFTKINISSASLSLTKLVRPNLSGIDFTDIAIDGAIFIDANIAGAIFAGVELYGINASGLKGIPKSLPEGWLLKSGFLFGAGADLTGADLHNFDFTKMNLSDITLQDANLSYSNLSGVDLTSTIISGSNLSHANIQGTNLTGVDLTGITSSVLSGTPIGLDPAWQLFNGFLIGPGANLSTSDWSGLDLRNFALSGVSFVGGNLSRTNLSGMDLSGIDLTGVNLTGANLTGTILTDSILNQINARSIEGVPIGLPEPYVFSNGYIFGPKANLDGANLTGMDLQGIDFSGASLKATKLKTADLRGAILTGAAMDGASLNGAKLLNVISGKVTGTPTGVTGGFVFNNGTFKVVLVLAPTPTVTGKAQVGSTLTADAGTWDDGIELTYRWSRNGTPISGADQSTYTTTLADSKKNITFTVTGVGTGGATKSMTSSAQTITPPKMKTKPVKVTGTFAKGKTVKANTVAWIKGAKITYSWLANGKKIKGATKKTFKIKAKQAGKKLSVVVTQKYFGYLTASVASKPKKVKKS